MFKFLRKVKGQSTLEYVIVLAAIIAAVLIGILVLAGRDPTKGVAKLMNQTAGKIEGATGKIANLTQP